MDGNLLPATQLPAAQLPAAHPSGAHPPAIPPACLPRHIAIVMDGNGRWANERGLPRTEGHKAGEQAIVEAIAGAVELGVEYVSVYAFSTENWRRSPAEVRFLMGYSREAIHRLRDLFDSWNVRIRWSGRLPKLWKSVVDELKAAEAQTRHNSGLTFTMCVNYGGRLEIVDAARDIARQAALGRLDPEKISEKSFANHLYVPDLPDVDLFIRSSGEQRLSNFMLWQAAYAELMFIPERWPDVDRRTLWRCVEEYSARDRRFGGAVDEMQRGERSLS